MKLSDAGLGMIRALEGCRLESYQDQAGVWTIGYGHTGPDVTPGLIWTQEQCDGRLSSDLDEFIHGAVELVDIQLGDNEFSALVSFSYNEGLRALETSHLLGLVNQLDDPAVTDTDIALQFKRWNKITIGGALTVDRGLTGRRACEIALWDLPDGADAPDWGAIRAAAENTG